MTVEFIKWLTCWELNNKKTKENHTHVKIATRFVHSYALH